MRHYSSTPIVNTNNYFYSNITTPQPRTWYIAFCNPPYIDSISHPLLKICQKSIPLNFPSLEFINGTTTNNSTPQPSQHNFNNAKPYNFQTSLTCNKQTPTHKHIIAQLFVTIFFWLQGLPSHPLRFHWKNIHPFHPTKQPNVTLCVSVDNYEVHVVSKERIRASPPHTNKHPFTLNVGAR